MSDSTDRRFFPGLHALRAGAALLVLVQHSGFFAAKNSGVSFTTILRIDFGRLGVLTFFCLSGFVIALQRHSPLSEFAVRRILRIYPGFWAAWVISAGLVSLVNEPASFTLRIALLLAPANVPATWVPIWSLFFEVFFYAFAWALFAMRLPDRSLSLVILAWILLIHVAEPYLAGLSYVFLPGVWMPISQYNQLFALGMLCALNFNRLQDIEPMYLLAVAITAWIVMRLCPDIPDARGVLACGVAICAVMLAMARIDSIWPLAQRLGDWSYGLFLMHYSVVYVAGVVLQRLHPSTGLLWVILFAVGLVGGLSFGFADYWLYRRISTVAVRTLRGLRHSDTVAR
ncbi:MAG TPA: acyltransferase [Candidatus Binatia bacterium]|nr:acyltransferase [Candidatus Binatia bacterium]